MDAGELDRRIVLWRAPEIDDGFQKRLDWDNAAPIATVWAKLMPMSGAERLAASENAAFANVRFKIRKSSDVADLNAKDRLVFDSVTHNIANVRPEGRAFIVIDAVARNDS